METWSLDSFVDKVIVRRFQNEKGQYLIFLYDLNLESRLAMTSLLRNHIHVDGFILPNKKREILGIHFLNIPTVSTSEFTDFLKGNTRAKIYILDPRGKNNFFLEKFKKWKKVEVVHLFKKSLEQINAIIYGAGGMGERAYSILTAVGITIKAFCDQAIEKQGQLWGGVKVLSPKNVQERYMQCKCVMGIGDRNSAEKIAEGLKDAGIITAGILFDYDSFCLGVPFSDSTPEGLHYYIQCQKMKTIYIIGKEEELRRNQSIFDILDIDVTPLNIAENNSLAFEGKNIENCLCAVLLGAEKRMAELIEDNKLDEGMFMGAADGRRFQTIREYDPCLGFNNRNSIVVLENRKCGKKKIRIAILGNSCTASGLFTEKSWPEHLLDILDAHDIKTQLLDGAVTGYSVSQELIKLIRDIIPMKPDIVISYSGTNEWLDDDYNKFINRYQMRIFKDVINNVHTRLLMANNVTQNSICTGINYDATDEGAGITQWDHWYSQELLMYILCKGLGIRFYAIIQPHLLGKNPLSLADKELIEHMDFVEHVRASHEVLKRLSSMAENKKDEWLIDFSHIFDGKEEDIFFDYSHPLSAGNRMVAEEVFKVIEADI